MMDEYGEYIVSRNIDEVDVCDVERVYKMISAIDDDLFTSLDQYEECDEIEIEENND
jgi:hypothetical protein